MSIESFNTEYEAVHRDAWLSVGLERGWITQPVWDEAADVYVLPLTSPPTSN